MNQTDYDSIRRASSALVRAQLLRYPKMTVQDAVKALYQSEFGCGHFVTDRERGLNWLIEEEKSLASAAREAEPPFVEPLGDSFCRVHIAHMKNEGLSSETLFSLFALSAEAPAGDMARFRFMLDHLEEMAESDLPLNGREQAASFLAGYRAAGCPSTHHSEPFRAAYAPAYRVIRSDYARFLPLFCAIDRKMHEKDRIVVAVEGGSASGKSTLGELLQRVYDCNLFHMDDFFLQMHQRTPERFNKPGGNVDYERFQEEILNPLKENKPFSYRVFDCSHMALGESVSVTPKKLNIVEGAYSMHPYFGKAYDLTCLIEIDEQTQSDRILLRNGEAMHKRFINEWIPLEKKYFESTDIRARCSLIL